MIRFVFSIALVLCFFAIQSKAAFPTVAVNCWYEIPNSKLDSANGKPSPLPPGNSGFAALTGAWNSGLWDTRKHRVCVIGGGHTDYAGSEWYCLTPDSSYTGWYRISDNPPVFDSTETLPFYNDVTNGKIPRPGHNYDGVEFDSTNNKYLVFGSPYPFFDATPPHKLVYRYDVATNTWDDSITGFVGDPGTVAVARDDSAGKIWAMAKGNQGVIHEYSFSSQTMTNRAASWEDGGYAQYHTFTVLPQKKRIIGIGSTDNTLGTDRIRWWPIKSSGSITGTDTTIASCDSLSKMSAPGFEWSPVDRKIVGWKGGTAVYTMDSTMTCAEVAASGSNTVTPSTPNVTGTYGRWRYMPRYNAFILVNATNANTYIYRYSDAPASSSLKSIFNWNKLFNGGIKFRGRIR
jgi:hypothetical protein